VHWPRWRLLWLRDGHRIRRLSRWLAGHTHDSAPAIAGHKQEGVPAIAGQKQEGVPAIAGQKQEGVPAIAGPLGELAYRVERVIRQRERQIDDERQRHAQFLLAIEASPNGVLLLGAEQQIEWFNARAAEHFGLNAARDHHQRITNLVRAPAFVGLMQQEQPDHEVVFASPRGDATLAVLVRPYGERMQLVLSQDITERARNEAMRRDFVANVSHEIRSPLTVLSGFIESLSSLPLSPAETTRVLALMRQQADRMQALVTDLLSLAQVEGGPRPPADLWIDAALLMGKLEAQARASDGVVHVLSFEHAQVQAIAGAETELFSAFWNLLGNALRYTPARGAVQVQLVASAAGGARFCVRDDGPGIEKEHLPRLTERFYRVDTSRSRATGGTGLGLAIVKHVVQRHGGELNIASDVGKGSQFAIDLPPHRVRLLPRSNDAVAPVQETARALQ
jgi:two-component system, OmpR family, phosphate regulon sensor histidine kinase PhoR